MTSLSPLHGAHSGLDPHGLIACPACDALNHDMAVGVGRRARCARCGKVLIAPHDSALTRIVMLAATSAVLMVAAVFFPFLDLTAAGKTTHSSLFDAIMAFSTGLLMPAVLCDGGADRAVAAVATGHDPLCAGADGAGASPGATLPFRPFGWPKG